MSKKNRLEVLREKKKNSRRSSGCTICKNEKVKAEIDALIEALREEDEHIGYFISDLMRAANEMLPNADIKRTRFRKHLNECRAGWNEP